MSHTFHFTIQTPDASVFDAEAVSVYFKTEEFGMTGILAHHASMTSTILFSPVRILGERGEDVYIVKRGIVNVVHDENRAKLLCMTCEKKQEMSYTTAKDYLRFIEDQLRKGKQMSDFHLRFLETEKLAIEELMKTEKSQ